MNIFAQLRALTSGIVLGGTLAIVCNMLGVRPLAVASLIGAFAFVVLMHDVRRIIFVATGVQPAWWQIFALCTIGPATSMWLRFMCFMNGHRDLRIDFGTKDGAKFLGARCSRCQRFVRPATSVEAQEYMRARMSQMSIAIEASFAPLREAMKGAGDAIREFATTTTSAFDSLDKQRRRRNAPPPS